LSSGFRLAIESGARDLRVVSDFRISDLDAAVGLLERSGVGADFEPVGGPVRNAGISRFEVGSGSSVFAAELELFAEEAAGDSIQVDVQVEDRVVASAWFPAPEPGARQRITMPLPGPTSDGSLTRYSAIAALEGDGFADDDERIVYVRSSANDGGVVLISTAPDWEPRFLLPTLRDVTGFEGEGYLAIAEGRFLRSFQEEGSVASVDSAAVRRRAFRAEIVVIHSVALLDDWMRSWLPRLNRVILIAPDPEAVGALGVTAAPGRFAEWYVDDDAPVSALTGGLAGVDFEGLPPLGPLLDVEGAPGWSIALRARAPEQGSSVPALLLRGGRRRVVLVTAQGWWRWAFREGPARTAYRRVWSSVAGWILEGQTQVAGHRIEPTSYVVERNQPLVWRAPGRIGDTVHVRVGIDTDPNVAFEVDTLVVIDSTEVFRTRVLVPGTYAYSVMSREDSTQGRFDVQRYTPEMSFPVADLEAAISRAAPSLGMRVSGGRRLRTAGFPYFLLIAVLSTEWLLRRRKGLR